MGWTLHLQTLLLPAPPAKNFGGGGYWRWRVLDPPPPNITPPGSSRLKTEGLVKIVLDPPPPNITPPGSSRQKTEVEGTGGGGYGTLHLQKFWGGGYWRWRILDPPPPNITPPGSSRLKTEGLVKVVLDPPPPNITPPGSS